MNKLLIMLFLFQLMTLGSYAMNPERDVSLVGTNPAVIHINPGYYKKPIELLLPDFRLFPYKEAKFLEAVKEGNYSKVKQFLNKGLNVNAAIEGITALMVASLFGHVKILKHLLKYHADVKATDKNLLTALSYAAENGNVTITDLLICNGANPKEIEFDLAGRVEACLNTALLSPEAIKIACQQAFAAMDEYNKRQKSTDLTEALKNFKLVTSQNTPEAFCLLANGYFERYSNTQKMGDLEMAVKYYGLSADRRNQIFKELLCELELINSSAKVNLQDKKSQASNLHRAITDRDEQKVQLLLSEGGLADFADEFGSFPIYSAVLRGSLAIVKLLVKFGANVNRVNCDGTTPLIIAVGPLFGDLEIAKFLIESGAQVNVQESMDGQTPLYLAVGTRKLSLLELLIAHGANVDQADKKKRTPLMIAALLNDAHAVSLLIAKGANIHLVNSENKTALDLATEKGFKEIMSLLTAANKRRKK